MSFQNHPIKNHSITRLLDDLQPDWMNYLPGLEIFKRFNKFDGKPWFLNVTLSNAVRKQLSMNVFPIKRCGCFETEELALQELERIRLESSIFVVESYDITYIE